MPETKTKRSYASARSIRPRLPKIINREKCLSLLSNAKDKKIIYISGRAGQGKTTLALSWLKKTRTKAVWFALYEGDNDPNGFFQHLAEAFSNTFPTIPLDLPPIPAGAPYEPAAFASTYCRSLFSKVSGRYALVLDDFHFLEEGSPLYPVINVLIEALPSKVQIILISRSSPPPFIAKWSATRQVLHLSEEVLRFSQEETIKLFTDVLGIPITPPQAEALNKITDGWAIGLILLQEKVRKDASAISSDAAINAHLREPISDYIYYEIFRGLPLLVHEFMVKTCLFEAFSLDAASCITDRANLLSHIRFLTDYHLISEISSGDMLHYSYHSLLREFLRGRVMLLSEEERNKLVLQVGQSMRDKKEFDQAIDIYLSYGHFDEAIRLIEQIGLGYILEGRHSRLGRWIHSLPPGKIDSHPWLQYFSASIQAITDLPGAICFFNHALKGFEQTGDAEGELLALTAKILTSIYYGNDYQGFEAELKRGQKILKRPGASFSPVAHISFQIANSISGLMSEGRPREALKRALTAMDLAHKTGLVPLYVNAAIYAGLFAFHTGEFRLSAHIFSKVEETISCHRIDPVLFSQALCHRAPLESFLGMREKALDTLIEAEDVCIKNGLIAHIPIIQTYRIRQEMIMGKTGDFIEALLSLKQKFLQSGNLFVAGFIPYNSALYYYYKGEPSKAIPFAEEGIRLLKACHCPWMINFAKCLLGYLYIEIGEWGLAEQHLTEALHCFEKEGSPFFSFWALLGLARLFINKGEEKRARKYLDRGLCQGKKEGYLEVDVFTPNIMSQLLTQARKWNLEPDYVDKLMQHWKVAPVPSLSIKTLGRFEVAVHGEIITDDIWRGKKARLFLIALLNFCGRDTKRCGMGASKEEIIDLLWPEADGDHATTSFHTTLHRLKMILGIVGNSKGFIQLKEGRLVIDTACCQSDCCAFEKAVRKAKQCEGEAKWGEAKRYLDEAISLYQGEYLPTFQNESWIEAKRQALHSQFLWVEKRLKEPF